MINLKLYKKDEALPIGSGLGVFINQQALFTDEVIRIGDFNKAYDKSLKPYDYVLWLDEFKGSFDKIEKLIHNPQRHIVGSKENNDLRHVYQYIGPETNLPFRLGLTVHQLKGSWSSTPHQFEKENILNPKPIDFHEYFLYLTDPIWQWGLQVKTGHIPAYEDEYMSGEGRMINQVKAIRHLDLERIPLGSHPLVASPGVRMAYVWIYWSEELSIMEKFKDGEHQ